MAHIKPFKLVHYNKEFERELDRLITPPYDIITPAEQEAFYEKHPFNIIRLVLGKRYEEDSTSSNRYTRASATLRQWLDQNVLVQERTPGLTIYQMDFETPEGNRTTIDGVVALVKVDDYGPKRVLPHEKTYRGPKEDQLQLLRACRAHFTPIHALFDDEAQSVSNIYSSCMSERPLQQTYDSNGTVHRIWSLNDEECVSRIVQFIQEKSIFIADGHHRYETSRAYKEELVASESTIPDRGYGYVMMFLTAMSHPGLTILPAHRMVKGMEDLDMKKIMANLEPYFEIEQLSTSNGEKGESTRLMVERLRTTADTGGQFGMAAAGDPCLRLLKLKDFGMIDSIMDPGIPSGLRELDVTILRELILGLGLGLVKNASEGKIEYSPLATEAVSKALKGEVQVSFVLNPTRVEQVRTAAELGHKLPHKATYFFPKLSSGLVMNIFGWTGSPWRQC